MRIARFTTGDDPLYGVLTGDLVVVGGGDPTIVSNDAGPAAVFAEWAAALRAAGISRVNGRLIGDDSYFDDDSFGMGWSWDDLVYGYSTGVTGLSYNENQITLRVSPGATPGAAAVIDARPAGEASLRVVDVGTGCGVVAIAVAEGEEVKVGEPLAIVEAMKMENILRAERDVTVGKINAKKGDSLAVDAVIMEFA